MLTTRVRIRIHISILHNYRLINRRHDTNVRRLNILSFNDATHLSSPTNPLDTTLVDSHLPQLRYGPSAPCRLHISNNRRNNINSIHCVTNTGRRDGPVPCQLCRSPTQHVPLTISIPIDKHIPSDNSISLPLCTQVRQLTRVPRIDHCSSLIGIAIA